MRRSLISFGFRWVDGFGDEPGLALLLEPEALALDVEGGGMMQQPVEDGRGHHLVGEDLAPVDEPLVGGEDHRGPLVAPGHQPKEEANLLPVERKVAVLADDQHLWGGELLQLLLQSVLLAGPLEPGHELLQRQEQHPMTSLGGLHSQGDGQMGLAHTRRSQEDDVLGPLDEGQTSQLQDHLAVDCGLEAEVELLQRLDPRQPGLPQTALQAGPSSADQPTRWLGPR